MQLRARGPLPGVITTSTVGNTMVEGTLDLGASSEQLSAARCDAIGRLGINEGSQGATFV